MRGTKFSIDTLGSNEFEGYTQDEEWNGWACPYFTYEQAQRLVDAYRSCGWEARYDDKQDQFVFAIADDPDEHDAYSAIYMEGLKLYPIGAFGWIWEEAIDE